MQDVEKRLAIKEADRLIFSRAYTEAIKTFSPCIHAFTAQIEATGDDFVLVSGIWVEDKRLLHALASALHIWAFAVAGVAPKQAIPWLFTLSELAARDCAAVWRSTLPASEGEDVQITFIEPTNEWEILLPDVVMEVDTLCGFAYTLPARTCSCHGKGCSHCSCCGAINTNV